MAKKVQVEESEIRSRRVAYCRLSGVLAHVATQTRVPGGVPQVPLVVAEGRMVRDVNPAAQTYGVGVGQSVIQARRFCPAVLVVPLADVNYWPVLRSLLDLLADASPVVEPVEPDGAYADLTACGGMATAAALRRQIERVLPFASVVIGEGASRLAARACAECGLPPEQLAEASVQWLWPEDGAVVARLMRLGLTTFGAVAALPESSLVYQFGKLGRLLHRRAWGHDLTPVRPLYPLPRVDIGRDFGLEPVDDRARFHAVLLRLAHEASRQLTVQGHYGRRVRLWVRTEREECRKEAVLAAPVQDEEALASVARRLAEQLCFSAPVVGLRLLVEDLDIPAATTGSLFDAREARSLARLEAAKHRLVTRFGRRSVMSAKEIPVPARQERRARVRELRGRP